jgi:peptidoglycan/LPS O-acetylase OafA/YrhL
LYQRRRVAAVITLSCLALASVVAGLVVSAQDHRYLLSDLSGKQHRGDYFDVMYVRSWFRLAPYAMGLVFGVTWVSHKSAVFRWMGLQAPEPGSCYARPITATKRWIVPSVFCVGSAVVLAVIYGSVSCFTQLETSWSTAQLTAYTILSRPAWAFGVLLICLSWFVGPRGGFAKFFGSTVWNTLSRLSYSAYLLHPLILNIVFHSSRTLPHFSYYNLIFHLCAVMFLAYTSAAALFLSVESPIQNLESMLLPRE